MSDETVYVQIGWVDRVERDVLQVAMHSEGSVPDQGDAVFVRFSEPARREMTALDVWRQWSDLLDACGNVGPIVNGVRYTGIDRLLRDPDHPDPCPVVLWEDAGDDSRSLRLEAADVVVVECDAPGDPA